MAQKPDKERVKEETSENTISMKQYEEMLERIQRLEKIVEKQAITVEDLKNKLQVESDLRMLLQERMSTYEV